MHVQGEKSFLSSCFILFLWLKRATVPSPQDEAYEEFAQGKIDLKVSPFTATFQLIYFS